MSNTIRDTIQQLIAQQLAKEEIYLKVGTASSFDSQTKTFTFTPNDETAPVPNVLTLPITSTTFGSFTIQPAEGSMVAVAFFSATTGILISAERAENIIIGANELIDIDVKDLTIDATQITFNGGNLGGLIKILDLTAKLNDLVTDFNSLVGKYNSHTHSGVSTGGGISGTIVDSPADQADPFDKNDYENPDIIH